MFDHAFVNGVHESRKPAAVFFSAVLQGLVVCILIGLPLVYTQTLPNAQLRNLLVAPAPPRAPVQRTVPRTPQARTAAHVFTVQQLVAPMHVPTRINTLSDAPAAPDIAPSATGTDSAGPAMPGFLDSIGTAPPPPQPPPAKPRQGPVKVGGRVAAANLVYSVRPAYPPLARAARIQGSVEFTATISKQGTIENLTLLRGHPLLVNAARAAVSQWRYRPTLLNGEPVEVVTDITVNFTLSQ